MIVEYTLTIRDKKVPVKIKINGNDAIKVNLDEQQFDVTYAPVDEHQIHLVINGRRHNAYVLNENDGKTIMVDGRRFFIRDADLLDQSRSRKKKFNTGPKEVTPPMPAVVVAVVIKEGECVEKGDTLVVVSAMKMETPLTAPHGGLVTKINVNEGDKVMPGDILVHIDESEI